MFEMRAMEDTQDFRIERKKITANYRMKEAHFHPYYELYYLYAGSCSTFIGHTLYHVKAGDLILIKNMEIHRTLDYSSRFNERIVMNFTPYFLNLMESELGNEAVDQIVSVSHIRVPPAKRQYIGNLLNLLTYEDKIKDSFHQLLKKSHLYEILLFMYHSQSGQKKSVDELDCKEERFYEAARYICDHYAQDVTLEEVASSINMAPTYFSRQFKKVTSIGFKEYLIQIRVREATVLLLETDTPVMKIANKCGFNDSNYFCEVFKKVKGVSPSQYRKTPEAI